MSPLKVAVVTALNSVTRTPFDSRNDYVIFEVHFSYFCLMGTN